MHNFFLRFVQWVVQLDEHDKMSVIDKTLFSISNCNTKIKRTLFAYLLLKLYLLLKIERTTLIILEKIVGFVRELIIWLSSSSAWIKLQIKLLSNICYKKNFSYFFKISIQVSTLAVTNVLSSYHELRIVCSIQAIYQWQKQKAKITKLLMILLTHWWEYISILLNIFFLK